jgi:hypothetical protein
VSLQVRRALPAHVTLQSGGLFSYPQIATTRVAVLPVPGADVGAVEAPGADSFDGETYTLTNTGSDIWGALDEFRFRSREVSGDFEITARVSSLTPADVWSKAGVAVRNGAGADADFAHVVITPEHGVSFQWRASPGECTGPGTANYAIAAATAPVFVKLVRVGSVMSGFFSPDGIEYAQVGTGQAITLADPVLTGLVVTSHNVALASTATFDGVCFRA